MASPSSQPVAAPKKRRPLLVLLVFLLAIGSLFGLMALTKSWVPRLGLDLQGGMTITLTATNRQVEQDSLQLAADIIQQRIDSLGVGEASVATSGDRYLIVSAPNVQSDDLVELVGSTAQLTFRPVLAIENVTTDGASPDPSPGEEFEEGQLLSVEEALAYEPTEEIYQEFQDYQCGQAAPQARDVATYACASTGEYKLLLAPVALEGERVTDATAAIPQGTLSWAVSLRFDSEGATRLSELTGALVANPQPTNQFAIVLDGVVESNARVTSRIPNGEAQISGDFTQAEAQQLANILRFGSLPLSFETSQVETVSATLGGEQLQMGLIAGVIGLFVVTAYSFVYYRALGVVILGSLVVAAAATYASMVLLGDSLGFTLNLPAIAGAIVAIGMTADSFIIFFERIRDEVREGRSIKSAINIGWQKARGTIVVADLVSLLSAVVLFILAAGSVQGFAFMLGLTTLIDLAVVFFFTFPVMQLLNRTKFFGQGHKLSGMNAGALGSENRPPLSRRPRLRAKEA